MQTPARVFAALFPARLARDQKDLLRIIAAWREVMGRDIARVARPCAYRSGRLTVAVASPMWHETLQENAATVLQRLRDRWPRIRLERIDFVLEPRPAAMPRPRPRPGQALDPDTEARLQAMAAGIPDLRIRRHFIRVFRLRWRPATANREATEEHAGNPA